MDHDRRALAWPAALLAVVLLVGLVAVLVGGLRGGDDADVVTVDAEAVQVSPPGATVAARPAAGNGTAWMSYGGTGNGATADLVVDGPEECPRTVSLPPGWSVNCEVTTGATPTPAPPAPTAGCAVTAPAPAAPLPRPLRSLTPMVSPTGPQPLPTPQPGPAAASCGAPLPATGVRCPASGGPTPPPGLPPGRYHYVCARA